MADQVEHNTMLKRLGLKLSRTVSAAEKQRVKKAKQLLSALKVVDVTCKRIDKMTTDPKFAQMVAFGMVLLKSAAGEERLARYEREAGKRVKGKRAALKNIGVEIDPETGTVVDADQLQDHARRFCELVRKGINGDLTKATKTAVQEFLNEFDVPHNREEVLTYVLANPRLLTHPKHEWRDMLLKGGVLAEDSVRRLLSEQSERSNNTSSR